EHSCDLDAHSLGGGPQGVGAVRRLMHVGDALFGEPAQDDVSAHGMTPFANWYWFDSMSEQQDVTADDWTRQMMPVISRAGGACDRKASGDARPTGLRRRLLRHAGFRMSLLRM